MTAACCSGEPWREAVGGKLDCESAAWAGITEWAKRLMRLLLHKSPSKRITAAAALQHPFVTGQAGAQELPYLPGNLPKVSSSTRPCTSHTIYALSALHQEHCACGPKRTLRQAWLSSCSPRTESVLLALKCLAAVSPVATTSRSNNHNAECMPAKAMHTRSKSELNKCMLAERAGAEISKQCRC